MPREAQPSLNERSFVLQALSQGIRLDGRSLDSIRRPEIIFSAEYGSVEVRAGKSHVQAGVSIETATPYPDRKFDGIFTIVAELSPMASPAFESGRPNDIEPLLTRSLEKSLRRSSAVDTESLCLIAGRLCFALTLTLHVLSLDGGLFDASLCAATAALCHARIPATHVVGDQVRIFSASERVPVPLAVHHKPYCVTWAYFVTGDEDSSKAQRGSNTTNKTQIAKTTTDELDSGGNTKVWVADPTQLETQVCSASVVVAANREGEVVQVSKLGGVPANAVAVLDRIEKSVAIVKDIHRLVEEALQKDRDKREGGLDGRMEARADNEREAVAEPLQS